MFDCDAVDICDEQLIRWLHYKTRNHDFIWWGHKIYIKVHEMNANFKSTQWNDECVKTVYTMAP